MSTGVPGPHRSIPTRDDREVFLAELFDRMWDVYRSRVSHVQTYEQLVRSHGATFVNDHIAFRTFAWQRPMTGIATLGRIFEALGYRPAGVYYFDDKHLSAVHFQHPHPQFPKLFISELQTWLVPETATLLAPYLSRHRSPLPVETLIDLNGIASLPSPRRRELADEILRQFLERPWPRPEKADVQQINRHSQYAAWVLVHGYNVNHFTSLVNSHGVPALQDLEATLAALRIAGVPVKAEIEGAPGSKLRQSATEAVMMDVEVTEMGQPTRMPWSYAYFELAERNPVPDPATGDLVRFEGFLGPQATNLFEMTRVKSR
ncbi:MAG: DUF1338 domain-containing protein [Pirellulaceae bacterium]